MVVGGRVCMCVCWGGGGGGGGVQGGIICPTCTVSKIIIVEYKYYLH